MVGDFLVEFELGPPSPEIQDLARKQLRESPELQKEAMSQLRELLRGINIFKKCMIYN